MNSVTLPSSGLAFAGYPQRSYADDFSVSESTARWLREKFRRSNGCHLPATVARSLTRAKARLQNVDTPALSDEALAVSRRLRRDGLQARTAGRALALVGEVIWRTHKQRVYDTQMQAAWLMLTGHLVEMATGEGKTLAAGLAASVAALGGTPVHVLTANDYLVQRDHEFLDPVFRALSLRTSHVIATMDLDERRLAWRHDIVYSTAKELVFDYLRDHLSLGGDRDARLLRAQSVATDSGDESAATTIGLEPVVPGLCFCIVDEADSILLDEATVPLIISMPAPGMDIEGYLRAFEISTQLWRKRDYVVTSGVRQVTLTSVGRDRVSALVQGASGVLWPNRRAYELVEAALCARLTYLRDRDYAVSGDAVNLIDELTGRISFGRRWQGALHAMVEIKEGIEPKPPTVRAAELSYQRFFPRYLKVSGMSGTLLESRMELSVSYRTPVVRIKRAKPNRRQFLGCQVFRSEAAKWRAVVASVQRFTALGRPVLIGTESVQASDRLAHELTKAGIEHQLLTATQDADEAEKIAAAGRAGIVTVTTNMAGRGTDIRPDSSAIEAGGLHVIATMCNRARRIDRQLSGRAARQSDPGSVERIVALDDRLLTRNLPASLVGLLRLVPIGRKQLPSQLGWPVFTLAQRVDEWRDRMLRRDLRLTDRQANERYGFLGGTE